MDNDDDDFISKTRRKTAMHDLQALGEELIELSTERLAKLNLPENLLLAIAEAKRINKNKHGAIKRQRQYIGKLMRDVDAAPIRTMLESWKQPSGMMVALQHAAERWRERLLDKNEAFTAFASEFPHADISRLRQLVRNVHDERSKNKPPRAFRELYRAVHELISQSASPPSHENSSEENFIDE